MYPKRTGKEHRTKKKAIYKVKYLNFSFLNDIFNLRQEKSYFSLGESSG